MSAVITILDITADLFRDIRKDLITAAKNLHEISTKELWRGKFSSFGEYVESECGVSQSFAAKLTAVWGHYAIEAQITPAELRAVDTEKLYLAMRLPMAAGQQLIRAKSWSRSELKAELASKGGPECTHPTTVTICAHCHARI